MKLGVTDSSALVDAIADYFEECACDHETKSNSANDSEDDVLKDELRQVHSRNTVN